MFTLHFLTIKIAGLRSLAQRPETYLLQIVISATKGRLEPQPPVLIVSGLLGQHSRSGAEDDQPAELQPHGGGGGGLSLLAISTWPAFTCLLRWPAGGPRLLEAA